MAKTKSIAEKTGKARKAVPLNPKLPDLREHADKVLIEGLSRIEDIIEHAPDNKESVSAYNTAIALSRHLEDRRKAEMDESAKDDEMLDDLDDELGEDDEEEEAI